MKLGDIVRQYRIKNDLSQRQFAKLCDVSNGYISMLEEGKNPKTGEAIVPSLSTFKKLSSAMGMTVNELMTLADEENVSLKYEFQTVIDLQVFGEKRPSNKVELDEDEQRIILMYRINKMFREAVNNIYRLTTQGDEPKKTVQVYRAARSADNHDAEIVEMDAERLERLRNAPDTDEL